MYDVLQSTEHNGVTRGDEHGPVDQRVPVEEEGVACEWVVSGSEVSGWWVISVVPWKKRALPVSVRNKG